jgi:hypothetical protein
LNQRPTKAGDLTILEDRATFAPYIQFSFLEKHNKNVDWINLAHYWPVIYFPLRWIGTDLRYY